LGEPCTTGKRIAGLEPVVIERFSSWDINDMIEPLIDGHDAFLLQIEPRDKHSWRFEPSSESSASKGWVH
jgi:hypothetical protein